MKTDSAEKLFEQLKSEEQIFFNYMHENYPLIKHSNVFLRDIQYAIKHYFELKEITLYYEDVEKISNMFINYLETSGKISRLDNKTWKVNEDLVSNNKVVPEETTA